MGKYSRVLVAYDGSESSVNALKQALKLAKAAGKCDVKVINVMPTSEEMGVDVLGQAVVKGPSENLLAEAQAIAKAEKCDITTEVLQGRPFKNIVDAADAFGAGLIVIGRRGLSRLERMLMGSVTARVIGHTHRDVLVVPRQSEIGWGSVLAATDGSAWGEAAAERAIDFAKSYGASLLAATVVDFPPEFYAESAKAVEKMEMDARQMVEALSKKAQAAGAKAEALVREGSAPGKIVELAAEKRADLIVMGSHGRKGLKKLLMGSVTEKVIGLASCPVLVVRPAV